MKKRWETDVNFPRMAIRELYELKLRYKQKKFADQL